MDTIADKVRIAVEPIITSLGYELVDVAYQKQHGAMHLTVFIAAQSPITLDDCEKVHLALDPVLDALNPTQDAPYVFNVSSPGLDRPFKTPRDFARNIGKMVEVKLYAPLKGKKLYEGILLEKQAHVTVVKVGDEAIGFEDGKIVYVRPYVSFDGLDDQ